MAEEESIGWCVAEHGGFGVILWVFGEDSFCEFLGSSALVGDVDVIQMHILNVVAGGAGDDAGIKRLGIVGFDVADVDVADGADGGSIRGAHAEAEADENRGAEDIVHGDVGDGDIFDRRAVHGFQGQSSAMIEDAIEDVDVLESADGFGADFNSASGTVAVGGGVEVCGVGGIENGADVVAAEMAIGDGDVFGGASRAEGERTFKDQAVVVGGIDGGIGDVDVLATVDVHAVAVGVDLDVVDGEIIDASGEDSKMSGAIDGDIADGDIAAGFEADGLVADAEGIGVGHAGESDAVDGSGAGDGDVGEVLAPDQAVVPMAVSEILIGAGGVVGLGEIVGGAGGPGSGRGCGECCRAASAAAVSDGGGVGGEEGCALGQIKCDVALEMDGITAVGAGGKFNGSATGGCGGIDGVVDGVGVEGFAIADGAEIADVVVERSGGLGQADGGGCQKDAGCEGAAKHGLFLFREGKIPGTQGAGKLCISPRP